MVQNDLQKVRFRCYENTNARKCECLRRNQPKVRKILFQFCQGNGSWRIVRLNKANELLFTYQY